MKKCPKCGYWNDDAALKCEKCQNEFAPVKKVRAYPKPRQEAAEQQPKPESGLDDSWQNDSWQQDISSQASYSGDTLEQTTTLKSGWTQKYNWKRIGLVGGILAAIVVVVLVVLLVLSQLKKSSVYKDAQQALADEDYATAAALLEESASYGNEDARYQLGELYLQGNGVEADAETGNELRQQALEGGSSLASYGFAMEDLNTYAETGDSTALSSCLERLEASKESEALYQRSLLMRTAGEIEQADTLLEKAVDADCLAAVCDMAQNYLDSGDNSAAMKLLESYPDQNEPDLQATMEWVSMHNGESSAWQAMQLLADSGCGLANAYLGDIYYDGMVAGQERDFNIAYTYYDTAAQQGSVRGELGRLMTSMVRRDGNYDEMYATATRLYRLGYVNAGAVMGNMMYEGIGVPEDHTGMQYIIAAANNNYAPAELYLASYYYNQNDLTKCQEYLQAAYNHGSRADANRNAVAYLGEDYVMGPDTLY